jgi:CDP-glucose 4,6-dehydratase
VAILLESVFAGRRVLVTGHTGFKGSWLTAWLSMLGADVVGLALDPTDDQPLFGMLDLARRLRADHRVDVRDRECVADIIREEAPEFIFHLAAQPLVRLSYEVPAETFDVNVQGVVNLLDAVRLAQRPCAIVVATTDKCYENRGWLHAYREEDPLGGHDPYSASKACAELVVSSYRRSFFADGGRVKLASARAGNVIGGGDWARDRIVPDIVRAVRRGEPIAVRNKQATRPWQHVLEPLSGYLMLAAAMDQPKLFGRPSAKDFCAAINFGPSLLSNRIVAELVEETLKHLPGRWEDCCDSTAPHEASLLNLAIDKAHHLLGWRPMWEFEEAVKRTAEWYRVEANGGDVVRLTHEQIRDYQSAGYPATVSEAKAA